MKNYGFVAPDITPDQFIVGGNLLPKTILQPDIDWSKYLPDYEPQYGNGFETYGCGVWGTENAIEILQKRIDGTSPNYSERYIYNLANVEPPGSDPHIIAETIRHKGLVSETDLPFTDTLEEFLKPRPMTQSLLNKGQNWLNKWSFKHEWLWNGKPTQDYKLGVMKEQLLYGPLGIGVCAWYENNKGQFFSPKGLNNNHWCVLYKIDDNGLYVFDSYDQSKKLLTLDHDIQFAKRYTLEANLKKQYDNILVKFIEILKGYIKIISQTTGSIITGVFSKRNE